MKRAHVQNPRFEKKTVIVTYFEHVLDGNVQRVNKKTIMVK